MSAKAKRIILHAGLPKTGTTSIQATLRQNSEQLRQAGVMYPGPEDDARLGESPNHRAYFSALTGRSVGNSGMIDLQSCTAALQKVVDDFQSRDDLSSLVISHELLAISHKALGGSIAAEWQDASDLSVVVYVRPLREWVESRFSQTIWARATGPATKAAAPIRPLAKTVMTRLEEYLPSTLQNGLSAALPRARIDIRSFVHRRKNNDLVENFVDSVLPEGRPLAHALDEGGEFRNPSRASVIVMFAYQLLLGGLKTESAREVVRKAMHTNRRRQQPPPFIDRSFSFLSDEQFRELEALDQEQAARFPDLALDGPVSRKPDVCTCLSEPEFFEILEWLKPYISADVYREASDCYGRPA